MEDSNTNTNNCHKQMKTARPISQVLCLNYKKFVNMNSDNDEQYFFVPNSIFDQMFGLKALVNDIDNYCLTSVELISLTL
jgi:hypothetical protein